MLDASVFHAQGANDDDPVSAEQHRSRSIEEWADDDDDEDSWKDVLQARVNQLELVLPLGSQAALHHAVDHASAAPPGLPTLLLPGQHALITDHTKPQVWNLDTAPPSALKAYSPCLLTG